MARIRTIKPQFWSDAAIVSLPFEYRLLFQGLWNFADDHGFIENHPVQIKLNVFPADNVDIAKGIRALKKAELIEVVKLNGTSVIYILNWRRHQRVDKPQPSKWADLYEEYQARCAVRGTFHEHSQNVPAGREGRGEEGSITQVGGGTHLSSAAPNEPPPPASTSDHKPWRCAKHQEVDVACYDCKDAKTAWKAQQAAAAKAAKEAQRQADLEARRQRAAEEAALERATPEQIAAAKAAIARALGKEVA